MSLQEAIMDSVHRTSPLKWSEALSVGIPEIDSEHRAFIAIINELNRAMAVRAPREEVKRIMALLLEDAHVHFGHEQQLFERYGYPGAVEHAQSHGRITKQLAAIASELARVEFDREWIALDLEIKAILVNHMVKEDMRYKAFLSEAVQGH
jgi:hemerythrin